MYLDGDINCSSAFLLGCMNRCIVHKSHLSCDKTPRRAYDIDYHTYESNHTMQECRCKLLPGTSDPAHVCISWIIDEGGMPIVLLSDSGKDEETAVNVIYCPIIRR